MFTPLKTTIQNPPSLPPTRPQVKSDLEDETPGKRIRHWIGCGVPLLLTLQLAEGAAGPGRSGPLMAGKTMGKPWENHGKIGVCPVNEGF
jgi:hypothetical protein